MTGLDHPSGKGNSQTEALWSIRVAILFPVLPSDWVRQGLVRSLNLQEASIGGLLVIRVLVWMPFEGEAIEGFLDLLFRCRLPIKVRMRL